MLTRVREHLADRRLQLSTRSNADFDTPNLGLVRDVARYDLDDERRRELVENVRLDAIHDDIRRDGYARPSENRF